MNLYDATTRFNGNGRNWRTALSDYELTNAVLKIQNEYMIRRHFYSENVANYE